MKPAPSSTLPESETQTTVVVRETTPTGVLGSLKNALSSAVSGAIISGGLGTVIGTLIGAYNGMDSSELYTDELDADGQIKLGGGSLLSPEVGPTYIVNDGEGIREALETNPEQTAAALSGMNTGLQVGTSSMIGGAALGVVKGGWVDYIVKERELSADPAKAATTKTYYV